MSIIISYIKDNYFDLIAKAILSILSIFLLVLRSCASKKLKISEELSAFLAWIPYGVRLANDLYPTHGDGSKRLNYVVEKCSSLFPSVSLSTIVQSVDKVLNADKKGGGICEAYQGKEKERSQDFRTNSQVNEFDDAATQAVQRRNTYVR